MYDFAEGTEIKWKAGKNLTIKKVTKTEKAKGKKKGKAPPKTVVVEEKVDSFFNFFNPNGMIDEENPSEEEEQLLEQDYEVGVVIKETIIPNAVLWFTGEIQEEMGGFDLGDEGEEEDEEEGEDAEFRPGDGQGPECKQQ